jgi:CubicO group peptidase (beta-lactamase class C family)
LRRRARVAAAVASALAAGAASGDAPPVADLASLLEPIRSAARLPALGGAVVSGEGVVGLGVTGVRRAGSDVRVAPDDRWHLGSCTKAMTATLVARLVERGVLSWDARPTDVLRERIRRIHAGWRDATLDQLLAHRGGAPAEIERMSVWRSLFSSTDEPAAQRLRLVADVLSAPPEAPPGERAIYSNAGYVIAGAMAEAAAGASWEALVAREVFEPLRIESAGFGPPGAAGELREPVGHRQAGARLAPVPPGTPADNPPALGPAGTVHASLGDWSRFVAAHLRRAPVLLRPETYAALHAPAAGGPYARGWLVVDRDWGGGPVLTHMGSNASWVAVAWLAPARDFAVLVTTNAGGQGAEQAVDRAAWALIRHHLAADAGR